MQAQQGLRIPKEQNKIGFFTLKTELTKRAIYFFLYFSFLLTKRLVYIKCIYYSHALIFLTKNEKTIITYSQPPTKFLRPPGPPLGAQGAINLQSTPTTS